MNKSSAKILLESYLKELENLNSYEIFHNNNKLEKIITEIALIDIDEIEDETLDKIWRESWKKGERHFPENKYNHVINYVNNVLMLIR